MYHLHMSEYAGFENFSKDDLDFLQSLNIELDRQPTIEPDSEAFMEQASVLNTYFGGKRRNFIAELIEDRTNPDLAQRLLDHDAQAEETLNGCIDMLLAAKEGTLYYSKENMPVTRSGFLITMFHFADRSQSDLNLIETERPLRLHAEQIREEVAQVLENPNKEETRRKILGLFDGYIWETPRRFIGLREEHP